MPSLNTHAFAPSPRTIPASELQLPHVPSPVLTITSATSTVAMPMARGSRIHRPKGPSRFAHADAIVWETVRKTIEQLRATGVSTLRVLDAGCGPGTWIRRIAAYAHRQGLGVEAIGVDISEGQLEIARKQAESFKARHPNGRWKLEFLTHDLADPLPWADGHFHIVLCNYVVLNHLPKSALPRVAEELCRVAS